MLWYGVVLFGKVLCSLVWCSAVNTGNACCVQEDYQKWLKYHKEKWRLQKAERRQRRQREGEGHSDSSFVGRGHDSLSQPVRGNMAGFLQQRTRTVLQSPWQLIQVRSLCPISL